jgi:D-alanine-D-alanine ligase-like ATP-grasp enzyme
MTVPPFAHRLRSAVTGAPDTPLVLLGNFEVEQEWARGEVTLPRLAAATGTAVVNRLDELALLLGNPGDVVVVKAAPDPGLLQDLSDLGFALPDVVVASNHPERTVTEDALDDPAALAALRALVPSGHQLLPHGASEVEARLARTTGLPLAAPAPALVRHVNSKVYSRRLADALGIRQPTGWACTTVDEWQAAVAAAEPLLGAGPLVVKEAFGVSGKGIAVVDDERRLHRVARLVASRATHGRLAFCLERWLPKARDLNYQLTVDRSGAVTFDVVKEALTEGGVHRGHRFPPDLDPAHDAELRATGEAVGAALAADGFFGVVGIDAMTLTDGTLMPLLEINARSNMSTYQLPLQERLVPHGAAVLARHYAVRSHEPVAYHHVRAALGADRYDPRTGTGVVVHNFATVNAAHAARTADDAGRPATGRLYALVVARDRAHLDEIDHRVDAALDLLEAAA